MKIAFLSETQYRGKLDINSLNARTEIAWQIALSANHYPINEFTDVSGYNHVFIIFPKGKLYLSADGSKIAHGANPVSNILKLPFIKTLKQKNSKVHYIQEGPHWWWNDYEISDQIEFYNMLSECDSIFAHNEYDAKYYRGLLPNINVNTMPTLMIEDSIKNITPTKENKVIVGGNFARWYGGFESHIVAQQFNAPVWGQTSHAIRDSEDQLIQHLPRVLWTEWMKQLSSFKYAVHLMPTVAAGTFSLNCAYFGIPCIGNEKVDTQRLCHPELSVDVADVDKATKLAKFLYEDREYYNYCSNTSKENYKKYYDIGLYKEKLFSILSK